MDEILKTCPSSEGCYWLPMETAAKLANIVPETKLTNGESRQIANKIEWFGYCFEPDARYGGGTYDIDQTLAVLKPFSGDQITLRQPILGAANLLRLCVLIAAADGQIDEVELDVFRRVIETQLDLTPNTISGCRSWKSCWCKTHLPQKKLWRTLPNLFRRTSGF